MLTLSSSWPSETESVLPRAFVNGEARMCCGGGADEDLVAHCDRARGLEAKRQAFMGACRGLEIATPARGGGADRDLGL